MAVAEAKRTGSGNYTHRLILEIHPKGSLHDIDLADGFDNIGEYLDGLGLIGDNYSAPDIIDAVNKLDQHGAEKILAKSKPGYKGNFRVLLADGKSNGSVTKAYAQTDLLNNE